MRKALKWMMMAVLFAVGAQAEVVVSNTTWTGALAGWNAYAVNITPAPTNDLGGGTYDGVFFDVGAPTSAHRSNIYKEPGYGRNTAMGPNDLNYFDTPLNIQWEFSDLSGDPGSKNTSAYLGIFDNDNRNKYYYGKGNDGLLFSITRKYWAAGTNDYYYLQIMHTTAEAGPVELLKQNFTLPSGTNEVDLVAPTGLEIELDGTGADISYSITVSGTTFAGGDTTITGNLAAIAETNYNVFALAIGACNVGAVDGGPSFVTDSIIVESVPAPVEDAVVNDDTWTGALAGWNSAGTTLDPVATNLVAADTYDGVFIDVGSAVTSQRSYIYKEPGYGQNTGMGTNELNYFQGPLSIQWEFSDLAGDPGAKVTSAYLALFDDASRTKYFPGNNNDGFSFSVSRKHLASRTNDYYYLQIHRIYGDGSTQPQLISKHNFTLPNGTNEVDLIAPTGLDIELDGTSGTNVSYSVTVSGTTFGGASTISGSTTNILESDYSNFVLAIGAYNTGAVNDGLSYILDSIVVQKQLEEVAPFDVISGPNFMPNGDLTQLSGMTPPGENKYNVQGSFGDYSGLWGKTATVDGWSPYYDDPDGLTTNIGAPHTDDGGLLGGTFYLDTHITTDGELTLNSSMNYLNGMKQENFLSQVNSNATYELRIDVVQKDGGTDQSSATFTAALTAGADATNTANAVSGSLMSIAASTLPTAEGTFQTASISGADLLAAQALGQVNVIFDHVNTEAIVDYPGGTPDPTDANQVSQLKVYEVALVITVPEAGDVNKDGVIDAADLALAETYLAGDGGDSATNRQDILIGQGSTPAEALATLNLTDFDVDGDGYFDADDVTALEALLVPDPVMVQVDLIAGTLDFAWNSNDGKTYDLHSCSSLTLNDWDAHGSFTNIAATLPTNSLNGVATDGLARFFRIIEK
ncbi:hypothetical protein PDESU_02210 [Pontiella desulfatans]|uniref:Dockerin domain-containing protein n=1 Tax=Pontiella desulfatans TaxID=2750659 RepID=A0A6C2U198_PONDE|nr:dockerin type I repeat-containing protein [Pontiella desulfatans]VGO13653.1 hypothetical protein PDESU_02210 [Pontiella desulfatans]